MSVVTNVSFATEDRESVRHGATAATVLRLYLDQYKFEHTYRLMKSGMGVDSVFVRTPKRADAFLFVVAVATLISSVIDALLRRSACPYWTARRADEAIQHAAFAYIEGIGLDPSALFGKRRASVGTGVPQRMLSPTNRLQRVSKSRQRCYPEIIFRGVIL